MFFCTVILTNSVLFCVRLSHLIIKFDLIDWVTCVILKPLPLCVTEIMFCCWTWRVCMCVDMVLRWQQVFMPSGRMLGGSDSFSNMIYARGNPQDYDVWASMGATGWSYDDILPYFIKSENNRNSFFKTSRTFLSIFWLLAVPASVHQSGRPDRSTWPKVVQLDLK